MSILSRSGGLALRSLSALRGLGALVAIRPEDTYIATSIRGLGPCKSTYCRAERRPLPASAERMPLPSAPLMIVASLVLSGCASQSFVPGELGTTPAAGGLADCQNHAAPVSPGPRFRAVPGGHERGGSAPRNADCSAAGSTATLAKAAANDAFSGAAEDLARAS